MPLFLTGDNLFITLLAVVIGSGLLYFLIRYAVEAGNTKLFHELKTQNKLMGKLLKVNGITIEEICDADNTDESLAKYLAGF